MVAINLCRSDHISESTLQWYVISADQILPFPCVLGVTLGALRRVTKRAPQISHRRKRLTQDRNGVTDMFDMKNLTRLNLKTALEMRSEWPTASHKNGCKH
jgi:hypothetical protein